MSRVFQSRVQFPADPIRRAVKVGGSSESGLRRHVPQVFSMSLPFHTISISTIKAEMPDKNKVKKNTVMNEGKGLCEIP